MIKITKINTPAAPSSCTKTKVAAYCRVSTASGDQLVSLEAQNVHYETFIKKNPEWEYAGLYYDEGISGTKTEKRLGLKKMLKDCEAGKINLVVTKSISRFSRNTTDCLEMVRSLQAKGVGIYFEKEKINTLDMEGELLLSIMSSMAEDESVSISANVTWGVRKRFMDGTYIIGCPPYGYRNQDGEMVVVPDEAEIVKEIFRRALSGDGSKKLADDLNSRGILTRRTNHWTPATIRSILGNEKYTGAVMFQKTYTDENFNRHANHGERNQYYMADHHEAIISEEDFEAAAIILSQRAAEKGNGAKTERYQNRYTFSGKIKCGSCGGTFKRRMHYKPSGDYVAWTCNTHIEHKEECGMKFVTDKALKDAFVIMMRKLAFAQKQVLQPLALALRDGTSEDHITRLTEIESQIEKNAEQQSTLTKIMTAGLLEPALYTEQLNSLALEVAELQKEKQYLFQSIGGGITQADEAQKLLKLVLKGEPMTAFDDDTFLAVVDHIVILSREEAEFHLKCGLKLKERLVM